MIGKLFGGGDNDTLDGGSGADDLRGGDGNDYIFGDIGNDRLTGNNGADILEDGGAGDLLFGGGGGDTFVFEDISNMGVDRVKDWQDGSDILDLTDFGFNSFAEVTALTSVFETTGIRILFEPAKGIVIENFDLANFDASDVII